MAVKIIFDDMNYRCFQFEKKYANTMIITVRESEMSKEYGLNI